MLNKDVSEKKTSIISVRVGAEIKNKLHVESEMSNISLNTLISQILYKHVRWDRFAEDMGFVFLTKAFLRSLLEHIDETTITRIAVTTCRGAIKDAVLYMAGELTIGSFLEALDTWLEASHIPFRHIENNGIDKYVIQHDLGKKWSIYLGAVISSILNELESATRNLKSNDQSLTFEIEKIHK
jgi:hypothetical protein